MSNLQNVASLLAEGLNADAYFEAHSAAPTGTIAAFLGLKKGGAKIVREVIVKDLRVGCYNEYGEFVCNERNKAKRHVVVKGDHPSVTLAGYQAIRAIHILSLERAARIRA